MLTLQPFYLYSILGLFITMSFFFKLSKQPFPFYKIITLFVFFIALNALLAFFGEDFYVALAFATEFPVFFSFFFFLTTKSQLNAEVDKPSDKKSYKTGLALVFLLCFAFIVVEKNESQFWVYLELVQQSQKSDFFLFFLFFYVLAPKTIFFVGVLITLATLFLVYITFNAQILSLTKIKQNKEIAWAKNQNQTTQTNKKSSTLHFRP